MSASLWLWFCGAGAVLAALGGWLRSERYRLRAEGLQDQLDWFRGALRDSEERQQALQATLTRQTSTAAALEARLETERAQLTRSNLLEPVAAQLAGFRAGLERLHREEGEERAALKARLDRLGALSESVSAETRSLRSALKGHTAVKGQWGELLLEQVLAGSGLRPHQDFELQPTFSTTTGRKQRPDCVVHLPGGRDLIIDAKAPFDPEWLDDEGALRRDAQAALLTRLRRQLRLLKDRNYGELPGLASLELILLFLPTDALLGAALSAAPGLQREALDQGIVLVTPQTLVLVLDLVRRLWRRDRFSQEVDALTREAAGLEQHLHRASQALTAHCRQLALAEHSGRALKEQLEQGPEGLLAVAEQLRRLGTNGEKAVFSGEKTA